MPNILLTTYCNRRCPYCFALDAMQDAQAREMTMRELVTVADMIVASKRPSTGVLGGEPTLHPQFFDMISYLLARNLAVRVFTNGLCDEKLMDQLMAVPSRERLKFIVNVNFPDIETEQNRLRQERFIQRFAKQCDLGLNVFRADLDMLFLAELAERTGVRHARIRIGLAQPIVGQANEFLALDEYRKVASGIAELAERVFDLGLIVSLDCGFPLCAFSDQQLGRLRRTNASLKFICRTATDITPGLTAWSCFPLARQNPVHVDETVNLRALERHFLDANEKLRGQGQGGVFKECGDCRYRKAGVCDGGCLAHIVGGEAASLSMAN